MKSWKMQSSRYRPARTSPIATSNLVVFDALTGDRTGSTTSEWKLINDTVDGTQRNILRPTEERYPIYVPSGLIAEGNSKITTSTTNNNSQEISSIELAEGNIDISGTNITLAADIKVDISGANIKLAAEQDDVNISGKNINLLTSEKLDCSSNNFDCNVANNIIMDGKQKTRISGGDGTHGGGVAIQLGGPLSGGKEDTYNGSFTIDYRERGDSNGSGMGQGGGQGAINILNAVSDQKGGPFGVGQGGGWACVLFDTPAATWGKEGPDVYHFTTPSGSKTFAIPHPLVKLSNTTTLLHACVEAPTVDNMYRGRCKLVDGKGVVSLDENERYRMTPGTFQALNKDPQVYLTNNNNFDRVVGHVTGSDLHIQCENNNSTACIDWLVVATRCDPSVHECQNTDSNGNLIVEKTRN